MQVLLMFFSETLNPLTCSQFTGWVHLKWLLQLTITNYGLFLSLYYSSHSHSVFKSLSHQYSSSLILTHACTVDVQCVSCVTKPIEVLALVECVTQGTFAEEARVGVFTCVRTSTILNRTFIDVYK